MVGNIVPKTVVLYRTKAVIGKINTCDEKTDTRTIKYGTTENEICNVLEVIFQEGSGRSIKTTPPVWFHGNPSIAWKQLPRVDPAHLMIEENLQSTTIELIMR